jgi:hypothetical protein
MSTARMRGFSIIELMLALLVQMILLLILYFAGSNVLHDVEGAQGTRAAKDAVMIGQGLWGPNEDINAYVGDNGYPTGGFGSAATSALTMKNLVMPGTCANAATYLGVTGGWHGPYIGITLNAETSQQDPWQNAWFIRTDGTVQSAGPDHVLNTADDIYGAGGIPTGGTASGPALYGLTGSLVVYVFDPSGRPLPGVGSTQFTMRVSNPTGTGTQAMTLTTVVPDTTVGNLYIINGLVPGQHAVEVVGPAEDPSGSTSTTTNAKTWVCDGSARGALPTWAGAFPTGLFLSPTGVPVQYHGDTCTQLYGHAIGFVTGGNSISAVNVRLH